MEKNIDETLNNDNLIFGKDKTNNIVSLESNDNFIELFIQNEGGEVNSYKVPNKFWILCNKDLGGMRRLNGNSYYCWGKQSLTKNDLYKFKNRHYKEDLFLIYDNKEQSMVLKGLTYYKGMKPKDVSILSFDLETTGLNHNDDAKILLISNTFRQGNIIKKKLFSYDEYNDQGEMLQDWCHWVRERDPSIIIAHNGNGFDIPYVNFIANKYEVSLNLGRDGSALKIKTKESKKRVDGSRDIMYFKSHIYGREIIDTMFLAINHDAHTKKYVSYGLKQIIKQEGLEKVNRTFYDASKIRENYKDKVQWALIKEYCKDDSDDALALFDLTCAPQFYLANNIPKSFQSITESATGSQINSMMLRSYIQNAHSVPKADQIEEQFEGALSYGSPGIFSNCIKWDVASLYPSIMLQYKIQHKEKDPNCNFQNILQVFTTERLKNKKLAKETKNSYYKDLEQSQKILINSMYGFL